MRSEINYDYSILLGIYLFLLPFQSYYQIPLLFLAVFGFIGLFKNKFKTKFDNASIKTISCMFLCLWIPAFFSVVDAVNFNRSVGTVFSMLGMLLACIGALFAADKFQSYNKLEIIFFGVLAFWCIDGFVQYFLGTNILGYAISNPRRLSGIFSPKLTLGLVIAVFFPVVLDAVWRKSYQSFWYWVLIIPYVWILILSGSRTGMIMAFICFLVVVFFRIIIDKKKAFLGILIVIGSAILIIYMNAPRMSVMVDFIEEFGKAVIHHNVDQSAENAVGLKGDETSYAPPTLKRLDEVSSGRLPLWNYAFLMYEDHFINGVGVRGFNHAQHFYQLSQAYYNDETTDTHPHGTIAEVAAEAGTVGLLGLVIFLWIQYKFYKKLSFANRQLAVPWMIATDCAIFLNTAKSFYSFFWFSLVCWLITLSIMAAFNE